MYENLKLIKDNVLNLLLECGLVHFDYMYLVVTLSPSYEVMFVGSCILALQNASCSSSITRIGIYLSTGIPVYSD